MTFAASRLRLAIAFVSSCWVADFLSGTASAQGDFGLWEFDRPTESKIHIFSAFQGPPNRGFLPVKAIISNRTDRDRTWTFEFSSDGAESGIRFRSSFEVVSPSKKETEHEFMVPLPSLINSDSGQHEVTVSVNNGAYKRQIRADIQHRWAMLAFSNGLDDTKHLRALTDELSRHGMSFYGGLRQAGILFDAESLPADWRGYTGFDVLMLTDEEWNALEPAVRAGILRWTRLGGQLHIFSMIQGAKPSTFGIGVDDLGSRTVVADGGSYERSLGRVFVHWWDEKDLPLQRLADHLVSDTPRLAVALEEQFADKWPLQTEFGIKPFNPIAMFVILILFAIMVGPVNLFILAKPGNRHRLFITTPIISVVASLTLVLLIVFKDGFGGSGLRTALMMLESEERRAFVVQEQLARTGVLLGRTFDVEEPAFISPAKLKKTRWTHFDNRSQLAADYQYAEKNLAGDWFQSRSEQAHFVQTVRTTRARILQEPTAQGETPKLISEIDFLLDDLFYIDSEGQVWKSTGEVRAGQEIKLEPLGGKGSDPKGQRAVANFWNEESSRFTSRLRSRILEFPNRRNIYLAVATQGIEDELVPTLSSLRWNDDRLLLVGQPLPRGQAQNQPAPEAKPGQDETSQPEPQSSAAPES
ncbi:MAG: hypothetical protein ACI8UO_000119 [Verrucomicrobiales bacterium]|jgi:hypothetical protein